MEPFLALPLTELCYKSTVEDYLQSRESTVLRTSFLPSFSDFSLFVFLLVVVYTLRLEEREQVLIDPVFKGRAHAVRRALIDLECRVLYDLGRKLG